MLATAASLGNQEATQNFLRMNGASVNILNILRKAGPSFFLW